MAENNNKNTRPYIFYAREGEEAVPHHVRYVIVHDSVTKIPHSAFFNRKQLERVKLPDGLNIIGELAFYGCVKLREINFPASLETIHENAFAVCSSLVAADLSKCQSLEEIGDANFAECTSLIAVYFPRSLQRIGDHAFYRCQSLISAELLPIVQAHDYAFYGCSTLELRQPQEVAINSLTYEQRNEQLIQRSRETVRYIKVRYDRLPINEICSDPNITQDQLQSRIDNIINNNNPNTNHILQQTDELGMTALHLLCLNPEATPEMWKIVSDAYPEAASIQAEMITGGIMRDRIHQMVTPIKLWLKLKGISDVDDDDFDERGHMILNAALQKHGLEWNNLKSIMSIQSTNSDMRDRNEITRLYPFMQASTFDGMKLETVYHLAMNDPKLIYHGFEIQPPRKRARKHEIIE